MQNPNALQEFTIGVLIYYLDMLQMDILEENSFRLIPTTGQPYYLLIRICHLPGIISFWANSIKTMMVYIIK